MKQHAIMTEGDPGTFDITDKDNPLYYIARYAHECSDNLYHLNNAGFLWEQNVSAGITTWQEEWYTFEGLFNTWLSNAVEASEDGDPIPALPTIPWNDVVTGVGGYTHVLLYALVRLAMLYLKKKFEGDTDTTEIVQVLRQAFIDQDGGGDEYALIKQMANTPIEIVVSKNDEFDDIGYSDRPET